MKIHLSRFVCGEPFSNLKRMEEEAEQAASTGAQLCVFPESFLHGYTRTADPTQIRTHFAHVSQRHPGIAFVFGSFTEERRNRMTIWADGQERARYDKVHLFAPNNESALWEPGDRYVALKRYPWTLGLVNCNDIRFPEQARALRLQAQCDALVVIGWWPWRRDHVWRTLLRARAIENGVFTIGCCLAASDYPGEYFSGAGNYVFDPLGEPISTSDDCTYTLDRSRFDAVMIDPLKTFVDVKTVDVKLSASSPLESPAR